MKEFTREEAIAFAKSGKWKEMSDRERALFQMYQKKLCMPLEVFYSSLREALGRPVYNHELAGAGWDTIIMELLGEVEAPSLEDIINLIPEEKRVIVNLG